MSASGLMFIAGAEPLMRLFTNDPAVVSTGVVLMQVAAAFQLFDGLQVVTTGALRGLGDTRTPMFTNLVGHWLIALPIAAVGGFTLGYGVVGPLGRALRGADAGRVSSCSACLATPHQQSASSAPSRMARLAPGGVHL